MPNATWCPWNYFRTSGDVRARYDSIVGNLQTTIQWAKNGLSAPGCWGCKCHREPPRAPKTSAPKKQTRTHILPLPKP